MGEERDHPEPKLPPPGRVGVESGRCRLRWLCRPATACSSSSWRTESCPASSTSARPTFSWAADRQTASVASQVCRPRPPPPANSTARRHSPVDLPLIVAQAPAASGPWRPPERTTGHRPAKLEPRQMRRTRTRTYASERTLAEPRQHSKLRRDESAPSSTARHCPMSQR